ncbi:hypothetical protein IBA8401_24170 [Pseudomonas syringae]
MGGERYVFRRDEQAATFIRADAIRRADYANRPGGLEWHKPAWGLMRRCRTVEQEVADGFV